MNAALKRKTSRSKVTTRPKVQFGPPHPWRLCPLGQHWVRPHPRIGTRGVSGHCRANPSGKDQIYSDELREIAATRFQDSPLRPCPHALGFPQGNKFDELIGGWTRYWNEVLQPRVPLDPDLVKALIATESGFRTRAKAWAGKTGGWARGLIQVTEDTQRILQNEKGELRDHLVNVTQEELFDPVTNIAVGIRWLFQKKRLASHALEREATWEEAIAHYKAYLKAFRSGRVPKAMHDLDDYYNRLKSKRHRESK